MLRHYKSMQKLCTTAMLFALVLLLTACGSSPNSTSTTPLPPFSDSPAEEMSNIDSSPAVDIPPDTDTVDETETGSNILIAYFVKYITAINKTPAIL